MSEPIDTVQWRQLAAALADMPDVVGRMLRDHVDAGCGRCKVCTQAGTGLPRTPWPCPVHRLATLAEQIRTDRRGGVQLRGRPE